MKITDEQLNSITTQEIDYYYNETNHSQHECAQYFGISIGIFIKLLKARGIKKDKSKHAQKIKELKLKIYGDANYNNRLLAKLTCIDKYGVENPFLDVQRVKLGYLNNLGVDHPMKRLDIADKVTSKHNYKESHKKASETYLNKTGYDNPRKNPEVIKKILQTKIDNGCYDSPGTSNLERRLEKILNRKFSEVINGYRDERYARLSGYLFECDFYIPEKDLFIELNAHPSHNNRPFNENLNDDIVERNRLSNSDKNWDKALFETWTIRDVEKYKIAKDKNLNYIVLYPTNTIFNNKQFNDKKYSSLIEYLIKKLNKRK